MARRKTLDQGETGFFASSTSAPVVESVAPKRRRATLDDIPAVVEATPKERVPVPATATEWSDPADKLDKHIRERACVALPRHHMHARPEPADVVARLRAAPDTQAPNWLCYQIMRDAAWALEELLGHCYLCHKNGTGRPCDDGTKERKHAQRDAEACSHYKEWMQN